jgi:hypothetical protein
MFRRFLLVPTVAFAAIAFSVTPALAWNTRVPSEPALSAGASVDLSLNLGGAKGCRLPIKNESGRSTAQLWAAINAMKGRTSSAGSMGSESMMLDCTGIHQQTDHPRTEFPGFDPMREEHGGLIGFILDLLL